MTGTNSISRKANAMPLNILLSRTPFLWRYAHLFRPRFPGSRNYWDRRYAQGGNSGVGSYGQCAAFKAEILNDFVARHGIQSIIEFGCGDGHQLSLASYPRYIGLDVSRTAIQNDITKFRGDSTKSFFLYDGECFSDPTGALTADLALSLDVIFHLVEDVVYARYMEHLFGAARRYVIVYSSNEEKIIRNSHERHHAFVDYVRERFKDWQLIEKVPNRYPQSVYGYEGSPADFYFFEQK
jgi:hypothetical protein